MAPRWSSWPCVEEDPAKAAAVRLEGVERRVDDVDAEPARVERDAAVDDQELAALLESEAVHPDLAEAAERDVPAYGAHVPGAMVEESER